MAGQLGDLRHGLHVLLLQGGVLLLVLLVLLLLAEVGLVRGPAGDGVPRDLVGHGARRARRVHEGTGICSCDCCEGGLGLVLERPNWSWPKDPACEVRDRSLGGLMVLSLPSSIMACRTPESSSSAFLMMRETIAGGLEAFLDVLCEGDVAADLDVLAQVEAVAGDAELGEAELVVRRGSTPGWLPSTRYLMRMSMFMGA